MAHRCSRVLPNYRQCIKLNLDITEFPYGFGDVSQINIGPSGFRDVLKCGYNLMQGVSGGTASHHRDVKLQSEKSTILFKPWRAKSLITLDAFTETANTVAVTVTHAHTKVMRKEFISHVTQNITSTYLPNRVIASPMLLSCDYVINILSN